MLVTLCTHAGDRPLAVSLARQIRDLGGVNTHEALIVAPNNTDLTGIEDEFRKAFMRVHVHFYAETMQGWPYGANEACYQAMTHIYANPELLYHYLMLEPDCIIRPERSDWLNRIDQEYRISGKHILGVTVPTIEIDTKKTVGRHTVGVAVWPKLWPKICPLVKTLREMSEGHRRQNSMPMPWDAYFGPYSARNTAETQQILQLIRGFTRDESGMHWDCATLTDAAKQITPSAVLIHGSKSPDFLNHITGAPNAKQSPLPPKHIPEAHSARQEIPEVRQPQGSPGGSPKDDAKAEAKTLSKEEIREQKRLERAEAKRIRDHEGLRKEWEIEYLLDTPECRRAFDLHVDDKTTWQQLREYAKDIGVPLSSKWNKNKVINEIVRYEREDRKEPWTQKLKPTTAPVEIPAFQGPTIPIEEAVAAPVTEVSHAPNSIANWQPLADDAKTIPTDSGSGISPSMQERMLKLQRDRMIRQAAGAL